MSDYAIKVLPVWTNRSVTQHFVCRMPSPCGHRNHATSSRVVGKAGQAVSTIATAAAAAEALCAMLADFCSEMKRKEKIVVKIRCSSPLSRHYLSAGERRTLLLVGSKAHILDVGRGVKPPPPPQKYWHASFEESRSWDDLDTMLHCKMYVTCCTAVGGDTIRPKSGWICPIRSRIFGGD